MKEILKGQAILLGKNIDTDQIYPGRYLELVSPEEIGSHCLEGVDPEISKTFQPGDILVAGTNFGCGSSREHAPISIINMGASLVIAESFARIFFRNAINLGLPLLVCKGLKELLNPHDEIEVNLKDGTVLILSSGKIVQGEVIGEFALNILSSGGIKKMMLEGKSLL